MIKLFAKMHLYLSSYDSPIGRLALYSNGQSICRIEIADSDFIGDKQNEAQQIFAETKRWMDIYFSGKKPDFIPQLELCGTDFQKKVWTELLSVPFGQTATYGEIAKRIGCKSAQAIGQAVGNNPILIIVPCHRIVAANGELGGFSAGIERKKWLLWHEGFENLKI